MKSKFAIVALLLSGLGLLHFPFAAAAQPVATTLAATSVTSTNATLQGTVNPNGALAAAYFQYGLTTNYDNLGGFQAVPATNSTLTLPGLFVNALYAPARSNWTQTSAPITNWSSIASSANGTRMAAVVGGGNFPGGIYTSTNGGSTWTQVNAPITNWYAIASSADGTKLAAVSYNDGIYTSTNAGSTWTETSAPSMPWFLIASSADGARLAAGTYGGGVYTSTNGGSTWTQTSLPAAQWNAIASSADGMRLEASIHGVQSVYISTNAGATWVTVSDTPGAWFANIASSADGTRLVAAMGSIGLPTNAGSVYISSDGGSTWAKSGGLPTGNYFAVASSADGTRLTTAIEQGGIYSSTNGGATWTLANAPSALWLSIASSADGTRLVAVSRASGTYASAGITNSLAPGTTYHYRAVASTSASNAVGNDLTFTTSTGAPTAATLAASGITATNASLNGSLSTGGLTTRAFFRYGLTASYGSYTATNTLTATNTIQSVSSLITNLPALTTYHFQLAASNSAGMAVGGDLTFTTLPPPPIVTTLAVTSVSATNATLNGTVNPAGSIATAYFQYGLTTNYDNQGGFLALPATNTTLTLPGLPVNALHGPAGTNWTLTGAPVTNWYSIASSADCTRLSAVVYGGGIYTSTNSGGGWTLTSAPRANWYSIASSADGTRLAALVYGGGVYTSTNGGSTWTQTTLPTANWEVLACSADGSRLAAAVFGGYVYASTNGGGTWTQTSLLNLYWLGLAWSADGSRLAAGAENGSAIYTSTDGGATWTAGIVPNGWWEKIALSADGTQMAAAAYGGGVFTSTNGGSTWTQTSLPAANWLTLACSSDGTRLAAGIYNGGKIYTSTNSGVTWTLSSAPSANWTGIASSADGAQLFATAYSAGIYTSAGTTNSLAPGTTYHYRAVGLNSGGFAYGNDVAFGIPALPAATTLAAIGVTSVNATLEGTVNPNWAATTVYFQYGLTTSYGISSATNMLAATNAALSVSNLISGLTPGTTYHFRVIAGNSVGTNAGADLAFTTGAAVPSATTLAASGVTATNAYLNASVNPNGAASTVYFQYGLTAGYGSRSATNTLAATNVILSVSNLIGSLAPGTTYHFRVVASNSVGTNAGADLTFTTGPAAPVATTLAASGITATNAYLNGSVNPNGAASTVYFQYGLTAGYGSHSATNTLAATNVILSVSNLVGSLTPGTTYHFRVIASNSVGTNAGADMLFTTTSNQAVNFTLNGAVRLPGGAFQFSFTNLSGLSFTVLATTNLALPATNWTVLGAPVEAPPSRYQFTDSQATNLPTRFYRVRGP